MSKAVELFQSGKLDEAVEQAAQDVRAQPADLSLRSLFAELLCFTRDWERADKQLEAITKITQKPLVGVSMIRHLIRSEVSRTEAYEQGRVPEFIEQPSPVTQKRLEALTCLRTGESARAFELVQQANAEEADLTGQLNGGAFEGIRDLDDILGSILEVFTATGEYYWVNFAQLRSLEFEAPTNLVDQLWRSARIETTGELSGRIYVPTLYYGSQENADGRVRIGRATDWESHDCGLTTGHGQREFLIGEDAVTIMELRTLTLQGE